MTDSARKKNWYVVTGGPSTGKTTLMIMLQKKGFGAVAEAGRAIIDEEVAKGLTIQEIRADDFAFQTKCLETQIKNEAAQDPNKVLFFDRGQLDTVAYFRALNLPMSDFIREAAKNAEYNTMFLLDRLPNFVKDYARLEDESFIARISGLLEEAYQEAGIEVVHVPVLDAEDRAKFILDYIQKAGDKA